MFDSHISKVFNKPRKIHLKGVKLNQEEKSYFNDFQNTLYDFGFMLSGEGVSYLTSIVLPSTHKITTMSNYLKTLIRVALDD